MSKMQKSQIFAIVTSALVMTVLVLSLYVATLFATTMMPGNQTGGKTGNMTPAALSQGSQNTLNQISLALIAHNILCSLG
jgi:hypothetical protein